MAGRLTTHVLDTAQGRPAAAMALELWRIEARDTNGDEERTCLARTATAGDGRVAPPLLDGEVFVEATYELVFAVGAYFAAQPVVTASPPFLDRVTVRFTVADARAHYHVPLLVSPWAYSTYRGS